MKGEKMKTYKLIYEETIVYEKYVQDKEDKIPNEILDEHIQDLSNWQIKDSDSQYNDIKLIKESEEQI
tara:strand:+ start:117 stop:320 length:204 start_codon:yes stop_codon:yes gene_type:complete